MRIELLLVVSLAHPAAAAAPDPGMLKRTYENVRSVTACQDVVGLQLSPSFPVPVKTKKGLRYRQMFYRTLSKGPDDDEAQVMAPGVFAEFDLEGADVDCDVQLKMPPSEFGRSAGPAYTNATKKIGFDSWDAKASVMLTVLQSLSQDFFDGKKDARTAAAAKDFRSRFLRLAEPGLIPYYRALSPEFWTWLDGFEKKKR